MKLLGGRTTLRLERIPKPVVQVKGEVNIGPTAVVVTAELQVAGVDRPPPPIKVALKATQITLMVLPPIGWQEFAENHPRIWHWLQLRRWWPWPPWYPL